MSGNMTPMEAYDVIFNCMQELRYIRKELFPKGKAYCDRELEATVIVFEALRRMEEEDIGRKK